MGSFVPKNDPDEGSRELTEAFDGTTWRRVRPELPANTQSVLSGVAVVSPDEAWAVGNVNTGRGTVIEHWDGAAWSIAASPSVVGSDNTTGLVDAVALSSSDVWAVGSNHGGAGTLAEHWDGRAWRLVAAPDPSEVQPSLSGVTALASNDIWAVGSYGMPGGIIAYATLAEHWDGHTWVVVPTPNQDFSSFLTDVTAVSPADVWAVGFTQNINGSITGTLIEHWNGLKWSIVPGPSPAVQPTLSGVSAVGSRDIWAVGGRTTDTGSCATLIVHWDGLAWSQVPAPEGGCLSDVHAVATDDVWAVGSGPLGIDGGTIMHWDGTRWAVVPDPNVGVLNAVAAPGP